MLVVLLSLFAVLLPFVLFPSLKLFFDSIWASGHFTFEYYGQFFTSARSSALEALLGSIYLSLLSIFFSGLVGVPLAYVFTHYDFPGKSVFSGLAVLPIAMPPLVGVLAFLFLFSESGILPRLLQVLFGTEKPPFALSGLTAVLVVHAYTMYVYFYLFTSNFYRDLDVSLLEAAQNLGAGRLAVFRRVVFPMMTPALAGAALLVFMTSMASFSAPFIFADRFRVLSLEIYNTKLNGNLQLAIAQSTVLTTISILFLVLLRKYSERRQYRGGSKGARLLPRPLKSGWARLVFGGLGALLVTLLVLPHLVVFLISFVKNGTWTWQILPAEFTFENYLSLFADPRIAEPVINSFKMATLATLANVVFGIAAAYLLIRKTAPGGRIIETLTMLPWAIPGTVLAISLLVAFNEPRWITGGEILAGTFWILPLAYFVRNMPLVFRSTYASLQHFDPAIEEAARNLGASWWYAFKRVMVPLLAPGILAGALLAFVLALGEFVSSILLYTHSNRPISVEIISQLRVFNLGSAAAYSAFLIVMIGIVVVVTNRYLGNRESNVVI
jgi:iron(III) transport system permease protein